MLFDKAATSEPTKNTRLAPRRIGFLPKISENFAHIGTDAAEPSRYAEPIHVNPEEDLKY